MVNEVDYAGNSALLHARALQLIPGGVNSPIRAFGAVGGRPFVVDRGQGAYLYDVDGKRYVDYIMSWGALALGHAYPAIVYAVTDQLRKGMTYGAPTRNEVELTELVRERMPWIEKLRLMSSATEACMTAVRIARGATARRMVVIFDGGSHGHADCLLVKPGSGASAGNLPASSGVPPETTQFTVSLPYNDTSALEDVFLKYSDQIAGVMVEPVACSMGVIPPTPAFLSTLRALTNEFRSVLIYDETVSGFRVAPGGAAELYDEKPDLVCLGNILGGGMPIGAVGGRSDLVDRLIPVGNVSQAGTLSGNPIATAAGIATLRKLGDRGAYIHLRQYADEFTGRVGQLFAQYDQPVVINQVQSLFSMHFGSDRVFDLTSAQACDQAAYGKLFHILLKQGVFIPPTGLSAWFVSTAHTREHLDITVRAIERFLQERLR